MRLAINQPYFLPYAGYFSLIKHVDSFILLDEVQFIRHGWIERNRILKPSEGWQYFQIPLQKHCRDILIKDILINNEQNWKKRIIDQLQHYKKSAPYFTNVINLLHTIFSIDHKDIVTLNKISLEVICDYLNIQTPITVFSEMKLNIEPVNAPDEWALNICQAFQGVDEYWNSPGGISFFDKSKYDAKRIRLKFHSINSSEYDQGRKPFEAGLSIVDLLMFNSVEQINKILDNFDLL